ERGRLTSFRQDSRSRSRIMPQTESCRPLERVASLGRGKLAFQGSALLRKVNLIGIPGSVRCFATGPEFSSMPDEQLQLNVFPDWGGDLIPTVNPPPGGSRPRLTSRSAARFPTREQSSSYSDIEIFPASEIRPSTQ